MVRFINGACYHDPVRHTDFVLMYIVSLDKWSMLHLARHVNSKLVAPAFQADKQGEFAFSRKELVAGWNADKWVRQPGALVVRVIKPSRYAHEFGRR